jgi:glycosyltransferase involved in cell wall biosynthesis
MKRRVCIVSTVHTPFDIRIFRKEARTLVDAAYEVIYLVPHDKDEIVEGVQIRALKRHRLLWRLLLIPWLFKQALSFKADVYHVHDPELILLALLLRFAGRCAIYDAHEDIGADIPHKAYLPWPSGVIIGFLATLLEKSVVPHLSAVITATPAIAENFKSNNVFVVNNYPEVDLDEPRLMPRFSEVGLHAIYVGDITEVRGLLEIVQAVTCTDPASQIRLTVIGPFRQPDYEAKVKAAADARVTFMGQLPYDDAMARLGRADVGLICFHPLPNHVRAQPIKILEYMRAGLPQIISNFDLWRELVVNNGCGFAVNPIDPASIAEALAQLREMTPAERQEMGRRGQELVYSKYNWATQGTMLLEAYHYALANK